MKKCLDFQVDESEFEMRTKNAMKGRKSRQAKDGASTLGFAGPIFLVIYDSPPLVGLADAHLIAAHTDGTIMVVKIAQTDRAQVRKSLEDLKISLCFRRRNRC